MNKKEVLLCNACCEKLKGEYTVVVDNCINYWDYWLTGELLKCSECDKMYTGCGCGCVVMVFTTVKFNEG